MKDWTGNGNSIFKTLGASNHTDKERESQDYYATDPIAIDKLAAVYGYRRCCQPVLRIQDSGCLCHFGRGC